ncbi:MAG TPA: 4-(cytidine 5'-diphospho)-2-C-methyl-D-erythritol kinase [Ohtaekwangia sp.]|uniref:4-(cytidine 5'-diphospho)-2-C-methyl-D-erythritol kinase n=1 Tax=Ohtaekwangia sp. TaxID=2066019 RepID=UPI002F9297DB
MVSFPPCKINLGLHIIRKRQDGYHDLETCFYPIAWTDILEVIPADTLTFTSSGLAVPGKEEDNLCLKAYHLLRQDFNLGPVKIYLHKIIPMGAGLGGGSSDAAHTVRLLNNVFQLNLSPEKMMEYTARLGSDCSFFIQDKPMLGTGRGEVLHPLSLSLKGKFLVLIKPNVHVSTAEAYAGITPREPEVHLQDILEKKTLAEWRYFIHNDFETSVFQKYPLIADLKKSLYNQGAVYASMSGSGASVFGIFEKEIPVTIPDGCMGWSGLLR